MGRSTKLACALAITLAGTSCASPERMAEATIDMWKVAYKLQPAAMTKPSEHVFDILMGFEERGAPPRPTNPNVRIIYFDLDYTTFMAAYKTANGGTLGAHELVFAYSAFVGAYCFVTQMRVGEVVPYTTGPLFIVTPRIHAALKHHEERHCNGDEHDLDNIWK